MEPPTTEAEESPTVPLSAITENIKNYLRRKKVGINYPCLLLSWNEPALRQFMANTTTLLNLPPRPAWLRVNITYTDNIRQDIMTQLAAVGGGSFGNCLIAPNNLGQFSAVVTQLQRDITMNPFIQACMAGVAPLATCGYITDRINVAVTLIACNPPPPPQLPVFA